MRDETAFSRFFTAVFTYRLDESHHVRYELIDKHKRTQFNESIMSNFTF
jgi:flagellar motor switch protein FliM